MFGYYLDLAIRSLKRNRVLTALMVLAIAMGIGSSMTTLTVLHILSGDPLPGRSGSIYYPQIDPRDMTKYVATDEPPEQVTWIDGMNLLHAKRATRQALMTGSMVSLQPLRSNIDPFLAMALLTTKDFFPMFGVPFEYGGGWSEEDDENKAHVVVISSALNDRLYGGKNSIGQSLRLIGIDFRIVGVLGNWRPAPHFYEPYMGSYAADEDVYVPLTSARAVHMQHTGSNDCWGNGNGGQERLEHSDCVWLQFWVQLDNAARVSDYRSFLEHYSEDQRSLGRFVRPVNVRLRSLMQRLAFEDVVPNDARLQTWLALGFLVVCLINTVGLMLAKFMRRVGELGVRRALGASRRALFAQLMMEAGTIGLAGGLAGMLLALLGLWCVRQQPTDYAELAHMDTPMLLTTFALAVGASLAAGVLPAWRACHVSPALQLKAN